MNDESICTRCGSQLIGLSGTGLCETCQEPRTLINEATRTVDPGRMVVRSRREEPSNADQLHQAPTIAAVEDDQAQIAHIIDRIVPERFEVSTMLGCGGMGEVWKAFDSVTQRTVAIKLIRLEVATESMFNRFKAEARAFSGISSDNVIRLFDFGSENDYSYMVLEYVDGTTLKEFLDEQHRLSMMEIVEIGMQICRGVQAINDAGVIHRDLKPSNIMLDKQRIIKVLDFGLAKRVLAEDDLTPTGIPVGGTPGFLAPEQLDPDIEADRTTDVWGIGATLYTLMTGQAPFPVGFKHITRVLIDEVPPPKTLNPAIPAELEAVILQCLNKKQAERYQSAEELRQDLLRWRNGEMTRARPVTRIAKLKKAYYKIPRSTRVLVASLFAVAMLVLGVALLPTRTQDEKDQAQMKAGKPITFVGQTHPIDHAFKPILEPQALVAMEGRDSGSVLYGYDFCLNEFIKPPVDSYCITGELRMVSDLDEATPNDLIRSCVGIYFSHTQYALANGAPIHTFFSVMARDIQKRPEPNKVLLPYQAQLVKYVITDPALEGRRGVASRAGIEFKPSEMLPTQWRKIKIIITPDLMKAWWDHQSDDDKPLVEYDRATIDWEYELLNRDLVELAPEVAPQLQKWSPQMGVGIFAQRCAVGVRNFTITPIKK